MKKEFVKIAIKRITILLIILSLFTGFTSCSGNKSAVRIPERYSEEYHLAVQFMDLFFGKNFEECAKFFPEKYKENVNADILAQAYEQIIGLYGEFEDYSFNSYTLKDGYILMIFDGYHSDASVYYIVAFMDKMIEQFLPQTKEFYNEITEIPYVNEDNFVKKDIKINTDKDIKLDAELTYPANNQDYPLVVLVHGSGANNMDEKIGPNYIFKNIAYGLSTAGIGCLRYNKRSYQYPEQFSNNNYTLDQLVTDDVIAAIKVGMKYSKKIYVLGHSLGGYMAPMIKERALKEGLDIQGLIICAGAIESLPQLLLRQIKFQLQLDGEITEAENEYIEEVQKQINIIESGDIPEDFSYLWNKNVWDQFNKYSFTESLSKVNIPTLILQGERDIQVFPDVAREVENNLINMGNFENIVFKYFSKINHMLMEGEGPYSPSEYFKPSYVSKDIVKTIIEFINN